MKSLAVLCSALAVGVGVAGCGGGKSSSSNSSAGGQGSAKSSTGGAAAKPSGKTVTVSMKNIQFTPRDLTVKAGTTVKWVNDDSVNHDVTKQGGPGPSFSSGTGNLGAGATYSQKLTTPGSIHYVCTVHAPGMAGTITVK